VFFKEHKNIVLLFAGVLGQNHLERFSEIENRIFASGLHAALQYFLRSGTRASMLKTSSSLEECLSSGRKGICGRSPERTLVAPPSVSWHRWVTSDLFEPDIGQ